VADEGGFGAAWELENKEQASMRLNYSRRDPVAMEIIRTAKREARKRILLAKLENMLNQVMIFFGLKKRFVLSAKPLTRDD
jgi:hypothetical protein